MSSGCKLFLPHFEDFSLLDRDDFFEFGDGFFEVFVPHFQELVFVVELNLLFFLPIRLFLTVAEFLEDLLGEVVAGVVEFFLGLEVVEFGNQFFVSLIEPFVLEDELGEFIFETVFHEELVD